MDPLEKGLYDVLASRIFDNLRFEILFNENDKKWKWRLWNGEEIIATGHQNYSSEEACRKDVRLVKQTTETTPTN